MNTLYLGDCLNVLRNKKDIPNASVDLCYIDPPFNSKRNYTIFFDDEKIQTQHVAFEDTWSLKNIQESLVELDTLQTESLYKLIRAFEETAPTAFPYLAMMALRLVEIYKVLKPTGSFYLHCDTTMSHYLKTILDSIFGADNFRNEIIWKRGTMKGAKAVGYQYGRNHDAILYYTVGQEHTYNRQYIPYEDAYVKQRYTRDDKDGRGPYTDQPIGTRSKDAIAKMREGGRIFKTMGGTERIKFYLKDMQGIAMDDVWTDIVEVNPMAKENLGYPTQKPLALMERIIKSSSNPGDVVLDAFCGCGTTIDAAEQLGRQWIGIDISPISIALVKKRLTDTYKSQVSKFEVRGTPTGKEEAMELWNQNPFAFQDWWVTEFGVLSPTYGTKGADKGLDGIGKYMVGLKGETCKVGFQVKGGKQVQSKDIDAFMGAMKKAECDFGVFLSAEEATRPMLETISKEGMIELFGIKYPKIQFLTLQEFFDHKRPKLPPNNITFSSAKYGKVEGIQEGLDV